MTAKPWLYDATGRAIRLEAVSAVSYSPATAGKPAALEVVTVDGARVQFEGKAIAETLEALGIDARTIRGNAEAARALAQKAIAADEAARQRADAVFVAAARKMQAMNGGTLGDCLARVYAEWKRP